MSEFFDLHNILEIINAVLILVLIINVRRGMVIGSQNQVNAARQFDTAIHGAADRIIETNATFFQLLKEIEEIRTAREKEQQATEKLARLYAEKERADKNNG